MPRAFGAVMREVYGKGGYRSLMATRRHEGPSLFGQTPADAAMERVPPAPACREHDALRQALPATVRLGTSSWSFAGWRGTVYADRAPATDLAAHGLAAYAHHPLHRAVGLDRSFYETPSVESLSHLAAQAPPGFRILVKAHQAVTRPNLQEDGTTLGSTVRARAHGAVNPRFLDAAWARDAVIAPHVEGLGARCGPIVFQFPALRMGPREPLTGETEVLDRLDRFLSALPRGPRYAVEFRNPGFLKADSGQRLVSVLRSHDAVPAIGVMTGMPDVRTMQGLLEQAGWSVTHGPLVVRWLLGHGLGYEEARARFSPFRDLAAPDPDTRHGVAAMVAAATNAGQDAIVIINNKAEGSAPASIPLLAGSIIDALRTRSQILSTSTRRSSCTLPSPS